jgi:nicotinamide-nucleotide amidase
MVSRTLKVCGIEKAALAKEIENVVGVNIVNLVECGAEIHLQFSATSVEALDGLDEELRAVLEDHIFGKDDDTLESVVGSLLSKYELTVAIAESCTGGELTNRITDVPGSSNYLLAGIVCYSNEAKSRLVNVSHKTLLQHGAVSAATCDEMAVGARVVADADLGVGITGVAGPAGGTPEKPVGLVFITVSSKLRTLTERCLFTGPRKTIKTRSAQTALNLLRLFILEEYEDIAG